MRPYLAALGVVIIVGVIALIVCVKLSRDQKFLIRTQSGIAMAAALILVINLICFGPLSTLISLATGRGSISDDTTQLAQELCEDIADEGITLLANAGIATNSALSEFYTAYRAERPEVGMWAQDWTLPEPPASTYPDQLLADAKSFSDQAMIVITRVGGEGADLPIYFTGAEEYPYYENNSDQYEEYTEDGHFLQLTQSERDMVELVTANFDDVVLVYNGANPMELGFVEDYPQIKSVLWCPGTGQTGFNALGSILTGAVNPSGRTVDTFLYDLTMSPSMWNSCEYFGYENMDEFYFEYEPGDGWTPFFVNYVESIYVGYKFFETAAEEGLFDYHDVVQYPFGYGLSYTTFEQKMGPISESGGTISFDVTVTNTGSVAGKDVAEYKAMFVNNSNYNTAALNDPNDTAPTLGAKNGRTLADLRGKGYDDPMWDELLDQLTPADMNTMISLGGYQTSAVSSVGKVQTVDCDGPASINNNFTRQGSIGFPSSVMIAATWNEELARAFGSSIGAMADEMGVSGWYAPAMNIHRSAFAGRNFEYYSEDSRLSGKMAAQAVAGAKEHGVYA